MTVPASWRGSVESYRLAVTLDPSDPSRSVAEVTVVLRRPDHRGWIRRVLSPPAGDTCGVTVARLGGEGPDLADLVRDLELCLHPT